MNVDLHSLFRDRRRNEGAFTKTELLVVIAALAFLLTLRLSALTSTKDQTLRGQCAEHLRQMALTTAIIANDNGDKLPPGSGASNWPWDMAWSVGNTFTNYMPVQTLYCPASGFTSVDNSNLWVYAPSSFHVIGYAQTFSMTGRLIATNFNTTLTPQRTTTTAPPIQILPAPLASQRVLFADSTISASIILPPTPADNFGNISGGYSKPQRTSHMDGALPAGGNLAMLDGHVEWRPFSLMVPRSPAGAGPNWWW